MREGGIDSGPHPRPLSSGLTERETYRWASCWRGGTEIQTRIGGVGAAI